MLANKQRFIIKFNNKEYIVLYYLEKAKGDNYIVKIIEEELFIKIINNNTNIQFKELQNIIRYSYIKEYNLESQVKILIKENYRVNLTYNILKEKYIL